MQTQQITDGNKPTNSQKKKNKQTNQNPIYASNSSSKAKTKIRNVTVGSTFGRFFTVRQMSPNPMDPI